MNLDAIQAAIRDEGLDGWLFFDHHQRDPLAYRVLGLPENLHATRRWYYLIPASGEPLGLVHRIEANNLNSLQGSKQVYSSWETQASGVRNLLLGHRRIAMQYSPLCAIPYVSMVDAGTLELVRSTGVEVVSSANLIQFFEACWSEAQYDSHVLAGKRVDAIRAAAFDKVRDAHRTGSEPTEYEIQQFIMDQFQAHGLVTDHPPIVAVNENASDPHYAPTLSGSRAIRPGDSLLIDLWAKLDQPNSVFYDITWMGYCGSQPPSALKHVFDIARTARDLAVQAVNRARTEGRRLHGFEVDDVTRNHIRKNHFGDYFVHRTGHSIGVSVHGNGANMDNLETHDDRLIVPNTCFSVEPGIYLPEFGVRTEVNVFVRENSAGTTGEVQQELVVVA